MNIEVHISPRSKISQIIKKDDGTFIVDVKSTPEKNAANLELIDLLSKYFNVSKSSIKIRKGLKSKVKYIFIEEDEN